MECKAEQRDVIRRERDRLKQAESLWGRYVRDFLQLGLHPMTGSDIASRRSEIDQMAAEIDERFGDNEAMRASYAKYLKSIAQPE